MSEAPVGEKVLKSLLSVVAGFNEQVDTVAHEYSRPIFVIRQGVADHINWALLRPDWRQH